MFSETEVKQVREVYNALDLLGDIGGISEILALFIGIFVFPISEISYNLSALNKLYLVNTKSPGILEVKNVKNLQVSLQMYSITWDGF